MSENGVQELERIVCLKKSWACLVVLLVGIPGAMVAQDNRREIEELFASGKHEQVIELCEREILAEGKKAPEAQDLPYLREVIGTWSDASGILHGAEATLARLAAFPGVEKDHVVLRTWLTIQRVIVLQEMRNRVKKGSAKEKAINERIDKAFRELELIELKDLSEPALNLIARYFASSQDPILAVPYYERQLSPTEKSPFKAQAELNLGRIEMRSPEEAKWRQACDRFLRVINVHQDQSLIPEAWFELGRVEMKLKDWKAAAAAFRKINTQKIWLDHPRRAEAGLHYGECLERLNDPGAAIMAYLNTWIVYGNLETTTAEAFEKWLELGLKDAGTLPTPAQVRAKKIEYYTILKKKLYQWQLWDFKAPEHGALRRLQARLPALRKRLAITPKEEADIDKRLGINQKSP